MPNHLSHNFDWIGVKKDRKQKVTQGVKSELTWLTIDSNNTIIHSSDRWWTIAFEMTQNPDSSQPDNCFNQVVETACKTYFGPQLSVNNSYGYSHWLLELLS